MTVSIVIRDGQGYIAGVPPESNDRLLEETSFLPAGYQYDWRVQRGKSDGRVHLLKHSKFPPGLLVRITRLLNAEGVPYQVLNEDEAASKPNVRLRVVGIQDRDYQDDAVEACSLVRRAVVRAPTGSGKTAIGARLVAMKAKRAIVIVPTKVLLHQYKRFLETHLEIRCACQDADVPPSGGCGACEGQLWVPCPIGQLGDGVVDPQHVTVATARTASKAVGIAYETYEYGEYDDADDTDVDRRQLREWVDAIGTVLVDEAHILGAQTVFDLCTKIPALDFIGMSASPWRDDGADLMIEGATGETVYSIDTKRLVDEGYLVPPIIRVVDTSGWWTAGAWGKICKRCSRQATTWARECLKCKGREFKSQYTECYRKEIVENPIRNARIAQEVYGLDVPTLVLVKQVKHGRILQSMMHDSVFLSGKDKGTVRDQAFDDIRRGRIRVLVATTIADMGMDLPALGALALAGGGKSSTRHLQRIGRAVRPYPGKQSALVIDFDDRHVHQWFGSHAKARREIEKAEWGEVALWI